jgi:LPS-assembly lipoprotein
MSWSNVFARSATKSAQSRSCEQPPLPRSLPREGGGRQSLSPLTGERLERGWWLSKGNIFYLPNLKTMVVLGVMLTLSACGFALRGSYELPYQGIFVAAPSTSAVASLVRRELANTSSKSVPNAKAADAELNISAERRDRQILSLSRAGRVSEYELKFLVRYQFTESNGRVLIPTSEIQLTRILAYEDALIIAKQQEEALLYTDMEKDAVGQILRRMAAVKKVN